MCANLIRALGHGVPERASACDDDRRLVVCATDVLRVGMPGRPAAGCGCFVPPGGGVLLPPHGHGHGDDEREKAVVARAPGIRVVRLGRTPRPVGILRKAAWKALRCLYVGFRWLLCSFKQLGRENKHKDRNLHFHR